MPAAVAAVVAEEPMAQLAPDVPEAERPVENTPLTPSPVFVKPAVTRPPKLGDPAAPFADNPSVPHSESQVVHLLLPPEILARYEQHAKRVGATISGIAIQMLARYAPRSPSA